MRKRKAGQPAGTDLDWFVIPIQKIRQWGIVLVLCWSWPASLATSLYTRGRRSPQERARVEIAEAEALLARATRGGRRRRGPARTSRRRATSCATPGSPSAASRFEEAFRLAVESQSYSRRALGGSAQGEQGDASFIFVEGDVSLQRAGRSTFEPARQRQPLFDGDFVKAGKTGSAEIMFFDGTLYTIRPGSLFECRRPVSSEVAGQPDQDRSPARSTSTRRIRPRPSTRTSATAAIDRDSRVSVDVAPGDKTEVTSFRGRTTVSTGQGNASSSRGGSGSRPRRPTRQFSRQGRRCPTRRSRSCPADNRIYDLKTGRPGRPEVDEGRGGGPLPPPDLALAALRSRLDRGRPRRPRPDQRARQGLEGGVVLLARRRDRRGGLTSDWSLGAALQDDDGADRRRDRATRRRPS